MRQAIGYFVLFVAGALIAIALACGWSEVRDMPVHTAGQFAYATLYAFLPMFACGIYSAILGCIGAFLIEPKTQSGV